SRAIASSELIAVSRWCGCGCGGAPAPEVETADRRQDERAEGQRHGADHELHNDACLPVLPTVEQAGVEGGPWALTPRGRVDGTCGRAHDAAVDGRRAVAAA